MSGKLLFRIMYCVLSALIVVIFFVIYNLRDYKNTVSFDGIEYKFDIYDVYSKKISFSRSERNPEVFNRYELLPSATIKLGGLFMESWGDEKLNSFFEVPGQNPSKYVPELLSRTDLNNTITVVGLMEFKALDNEFLYVSLKTSDLPNYTQFTLLKRSRDQWVMPSSKYSPIADFEIKAKKLNDKIMEDAKNGRLKYSSISGLK